MGSEADNAAKWGVMVKTILTVDDSPSMREAVKLTLTDAGYEVIEAVDGQDGLAKAQIKGVSLVLTDLNMPNMDGLSLTRALRSLPDFNSIPVMVMSSDMPASKKLAAEAAGACAWMSKPFKQEQLLAAVRQAIG